ncbi:MULTISPECIES: AAA family ATPase [unclassified Ruminococcus]|uniref:cytidylate kinase-like family protein n=1 Tax=unclassified Ruminococcus TaxID=2608920 RepID=UPI00210987D8|nr:MULTISPECIES: cytidylate kinase-like family protein [unclassified Ruminococcus]MCQ4023393.1 cytidylate kinase-like family protein [Ruminococcus sp. zg-924]MCQ4115768.1 cytidylate kinase-like family protein [Ruminococcus sp. zg-921]
MSCKHVITIGRQFGSGGRELGIALAKKLGIKYYDKELISLAAKESGYNPEIFENVDERATNSLLYSLSMGIYNLGNGYAPMRDMPVNDQLYLLQHKIIRELAAEPCVIVGRCADYILRNNKNLLRIFVYANLEDRVKNAVEIHNVPENKAESIIKKTDKTRANYYNFYSNQKWGSVENYDLCLNTSTISRESAVNMICSFIDC